MLLLTGCGAWVTGYDTGVAVAFTEGVIVGTLGDVSGYQVVDARDAEAFYVGHIAGAVSAPWEKLSVYRSDGVWDSGEREAAAEWFAASGLEADVPVLVYGDAIDDYGGDGYLYWVFRHLGVGEVSVLDGGYPAWVLAEREVEAGNPAGVAGDFVALDLPEPSVLVTTEEVAASEVQLLDVRSAEEYDAGHLPGAVNVEYLLALRDDGRFEEREVLEGLLADAGLVEGATIAYCQSGVRAGHGFLMLEMLGWPVQSYLGSWTAWEAAGGEVE